ncbi:MULTISPECIES: hypothetical protein [unclassified Gilliamella]|uniref:hypothetical protein n=1 Tax=unclassified Gilliamella TaxID=2685620 RepID=UPI0013219C6A|nr:MULTISPECIES: hypothetical protein [unclassified Gilliamella]MWN30963.1 hypothetical protein [Gilliamella sp. Pra-s60]MWP28472.1 hypothetical protein [Gilliamella sp. Pra-s54]
MTKQLTFMGHSDDIFSVSIDGKPVEEIDCFDEKARYKVSAGKNQLYVIGEFVAPGVWMIGVAQVNAGIQIPSWSIQLTNGHNYSPTLKIECPDDIKIEEC